MLTVHPIPPLYDASSRVLILGTMPSPKSREAHFFYAHPQNRFWRVLAAVFGEPVPESVPERSLFILSHRLALWDVLHSCEISGASDSSIKNPVPNDLSPILQTAPIAAVFCTGTKSATLYRKLIQPAAGLPAFTLPSPSPANCVVPFDRLCDSYKQILQYL